MIDLKPTNRSLEFLRPVFLRVLKGAIRYLLAHPLCGWRVLCARLRFPLLKTPLRRSVTTPEGFVLLSNLEVHLYCNMFVERSLFHSQLIQELKRQTNPVIVDVGSALGMAAQWFGSINSTAQFYCFEPGEIIKRAIQLKSKFPLRAAFHPEAVADCDGECNLFVGQGSSLIPVPELERVERVKTVRLDGVVDAASIFLLKIDTDGSNVKVLAGAAKVLKRTRWVLIETEPGVQDVLLSAGFVLVGSSYEDCLFLNKRTMGGKE